MMQIVVSGKHLDVGQSLRDYIMGSVEHNVIKFFEDAIKAHVTVSKLNNSKQNHLFRVDIIVNEGTGIRVIIKSNAEGFDPYQCFDIAIGKLSAQLRKYKSKIKNHHKRKVESNTFLESTKYIISSEQDEVDATDEVTPIIIAEKPFKIEKMSVADAVMHMDLMDLPAYMFLNSQTSAVNIVYYRKDGNISWISK